MRRCRLSSGTSFIGDKIERADDVNYRTDEQGLVGGRNARIRYHAAEQLDHIRQKHQKAFHTAFQLDLFATFQTGFLFAHDLIFGTFYKCRKSQDFEQVSQGKVVW